MHIPFSKRAPPLIGPVVFWPQGGLMRGILPDSVVSAASTRYIVAMLAFFLVWSIRYIKMSSPNMNNIIIAGCLLTYLGVFLLGTDGRLVQAKHFHILCSVSHPLTTSLRPFKSGTIWSRGCNLRAGYGLRYEVVISSKNDNVRYELLSEVRMALCDVGVLSEVRVIRPEVVLLEVSVVIQRSSNGDQFLSITVLPNTVLLLQSHLRFRPGHGSSLSASPCLLEPCSARRGASMLYSPMSPLTEKWVFRTRCSGQNMHLAGLVSLDLFFLLNRVWPLTKWVKS